MIAQINDIEIDLKKLDYASILQTEDGNTSDITINWHVVINVWIPDSGASSIKERIKSKQFALASLGSPSGCGAKAKAWC